MPSSALLGSGYRSTGLKTPRSSRASSVGSCCSDTVAAFVGAAREQDHGLFNKLVPARMRQVPPAPRASSPAVRKVMQGNRRSDTGPEVRLRSALHRLGLR